MAEQLLKLSPHRDLQCYFLTPSAIASMSQASESGFVLSGKWRQQFDWAVVEWSRDNVFEHPALRNLPDGDLSGLTLSYVETRANCIPLESNLYPVVDWNNLRIWAPNAAGLPNTAGVTETVYHVDFAGNQKFTEAQPSLATAIGNYTPAQSTMVLASTDAAGERVGLAWLDEHYYYTFTGTEDLTTVVQGLAAVINDPSIGSKSFQATWDQSNPSAITVLWKSGGPYTQLLGANGNRIGMYGFSSSGKQLWAKPSAVFTGGAFPASYQVNIDFGNLSGYYYYYDDSGNLQIQAVAQIPTTQVRKVRWTWAADLQASSFEQAEFQVTVSNWTVKGSNRPYSVAGPGSRRIEDTDSTVTYTGVWSQPPNVALDSGRWPVQTGNFSGSKVHFTSTLGDSCRFTYNEAAPHKLYLGTQYVSPGASITASVDGSTQTFSLNLSGEEVLARILLGNFDAGSHSVVLTNNTDGGYFFFDFVEIAYPSTDLPDFEPQTELSLATDWDTYHSQSLPAERTAWLINKLGFWGRVNHYTGALWFYEIVRTGTVYASATFTITLGATRSSSAVLTIDSTSIQHLVLPDETSETLAQAFALLINNGTNSVWASVSGNKLTITARAMGTQGNSLPISSGSDSGVYVLDPTSGALSGGIDGSPYDLDLTDSLNSTLANTAQYWRTDLTTTPRINRAARDWHQAYFTAIKGYGLDVVAAFSTELLNADPSETTGMAQRYPDGTAVVLNTPSIQTNFSPLALDYWIQVYLDMASLQRAAGLVPYLQSGEVQWWYFPKQKYDSSQGANVNIGMPFYDDYTKQAFQAKYGKAIQTIASNTVDPAAFPDETAFLPTLIGSYTSAIRSALENQFPGCRYEVLYPNDVNNTPLNLVINFASTDWVPANLTCLKTESFGFTGSNNLDLSSYSMGVSAAKGFPNGQRSHLVGIGDAWSSWMKEVDIAQSNGLESVVLFALDQYCLIGYPQPPFVKLARSGRQG